MASLALNMFDEKKCCSSKMQNKMLSLLKYEAEYLRMLSRHNIYFALWQESAREVLERFYGAGSGELLQFNSIQFSPATRSFSDAKICQMLHDEGLEQAIALFAKCIREADPQECDGALLTDAESYMKGISLTPADAKKILLELAELKTGIEEEDKSAHPWAWEIKVNSLVKILHTLVGWQ